MITQILFPGIPPVLDKRTFYVACLPLLLTVWAGVTINILPDEILLHIFHCSRLWHQGRGRSWKWHRLVHVCRRWQSVVFASPKYLQLGLVCGPRTPLELISVVWPSESLPIIIQDKRDLTLPDDFDFDAAIVHPNRVRKINLRKINRSQLTRLVSAMQTKFPALIRLRLDYLRSDRRGYPTLTRGFLGGYAPHLQSLGLKSIAFPPKLLLSTTGLVSLNFWDIPPSGYISPKALVSGLAASSNLKILIFGFEFHLYRNVRKSLRPPPPTRTVLPALTYFQFRGDSDYFENLVARIEAPLLETISISYKSGLISDTPQLAQFMRCTTTIEALNEARVGFRYHFVEVKSLSPNQAVDKKYRLTILCQKPPWLLSSVSSLAQFISSFLPFIRMVEHLYIRFDRCHPSKWLGDLRNEAWLEIFRLFTGVKNLYICKEFAECNVFAWALQEFVGKRVAIMLPALESLSLEELQPSEPVREAIEQFVTARQLLGHPVAVSQWNIA